VIRPFAALVVASSLLASSLDGAFAETASLPASKDNTLYESATGALSNGAGSHFFAGTTLTGELRRGLIAFDIASAVPKGAMITRASLTLRMSRTRVSTPETVSLHRVLADWGEGASQASVEEGSGAPAAVGDATWKHRFFDTVPWENDGGDFAPKASASRSVAGLGDYTWESTPALVADVQSWLDEPETSFGWVVIGQEVVPGAAKRFDSRTNPDPAARPRLEIEFSFPKGFLALDLPADIEAECAGPAGSSVSFALRIRGTPPPGSLLTVRDASNGRTLHSAAAASGSLAIGPHAFPAGSSTVEAEITDGAVVLAGGSFAVRVLDRVPPEVGACGRRTIACDGKLTPVTLEVLGVEVMDTCDAAPQVSIEPGAVGEGTTPVTITARDASGNESLCIVEVTVRCGAGGQVPGDCNQDGSHDISDAVCLLLLLFGGGATALPCGAGDLDEPSNRGLFDWNGDSRVDVSDAIAQLGWLFRGGPAHALGEGCRPVEGCEAACEG
jgi:hypothetical protein